MEIKTFIQLFPKRRLGVLKKRKFWTGICRINNLQNISQRNFYSKTYKSTRGREFYSIYDVIYVNLQNSNSHEIRKPNFVN
jgi:hypothetical protein